MSKKLNKEDWLYAGFRALCKGGSGAIRAEAIARELGTTKGSFYWHFKDVPDYIDSMLDFWRFKATFELIQQIKAPDSAPQDQLKQMIDLVSDSRDEIYGGLKAEPAIRQWAVFLPTARKALSEVDDLRLGWLLSRIIALGHKKQIAEIHAANLYALIIGLEHLEMQEKAQIKSGLMTYLNAILKN